MRNRILPALKIAVAVAAFGFICYKVFCQVQTGISPGVGKFAWPTLIAAVALMPVNWWLESKKWQQLTLQLQRLTIAESLKAVLAGLAVSMLTPNRIGDFAGRIMYLEPQNRTKGAMSAFVGSYAQILAIALSGVAAFGINPQLPPAFQCLADHYVLTLALLVVIFAVGCGFYFFVGEVAARFRFKIWPWLERFVAGASCQSKRQLAEAAIYSCLRYAVFSCQFFLMLRATGVAAATVDIFSAIAFTYCIVTIIPTFALAEWGVRGSAALIFFAPIDGQPTQIIGATVAVWLVNVGIPALAGVVCTVRANKARR